MASASKKRLALAIIDFLSSSIQDGTVPAADKDSIEVAQQCIADSFDVDMSDKAAMDDALGGQNLLTIYGVYEKLKGKSKGASTGAQGSTKSPSPAPAASGSAGTTLTPERKQEAEALKSQGNAAMQKKDHAAAIQFYTQAIAIDSKNPIFLSNRAAAYSASNKHMDAAVDAETAVTLDPSFTKAWSRLGLARFALGDAKGSMDAYKKGIDHEGNGGSPAMKKGYETAKKRVEAEEASGDIDDDDVGSSPRGPGAAPPAGGMPDLSALAGMLGGGGGGGGGGMPDLSALMNNPMLANMAQNIMSNPDAMNSIMNNPQLRQMASSFGGGGGAGGAGGSGEPGARGGGGGGGPDLSSLLQDPSIAEMARNMMGGAGRGRGAGGPGGAAP